MPRTKLKLNMLDPSTLPSASSERPFLAAIILVTSSGNDVPRATANKEIKAFEIPKITAILMAESTNKCPPKGSSAQPNIKVKKDIKTVL